MDNDVESHEFPEIGILEAKHVSIVGTVIEGSIRSGDVSVIAVAVVINNSCNTTNLGANI